MIGKLSQFVNHNVVKSTIRLRPPQSLDCRSGLRCEGAPDAGGVLDGIPDLLNDGGPWHVAGQQLSPGEAALSRALQQ
jgi:hypothetical protein